MNYYSGVFAGREGTLWAVKIYGDGVTGGGTLEFRGDEPLTIERDETAKEDVMCGSTATLGIISPGDRTYAGLYTIKAGAVMMDVLRDGALYWRGALDPELYEEPYNATEDYEVELTFSDFGLLERLKYELTGVQTLEAVLQNALTRAGLGGMTVDESMITTSLTNGGTMTLADLCIRSENFTDEDGEQSDMQTVMEGILQPLGLRMTQKNGTIYIYDLNGLYTKGGTEKIHWTSDDQTMGTDKVANRVKVTFSPYADASLSTDATYTGSTGVTVDHNGENYESHDIRGVEDWTKGLDAANISFRMLTSSLGSGLAWIDAAKARYFEMQPVLGGEEAQGVARRYIWWTKLKTWTSDGLPLTLTAPDTQQWNPSGETDLSTAAWDIMKTHKVWLPPMSDDDAEKYRIRIKMEMMVDARLNPNEESGDYNNKDAQGKLTYNFNVAYTEMAVSLLDDSGAVKATWDNSGNTYEASARLGMNAGAWKSGSAGVCRLEYYDKEDPYDGCGIGGWTSNRPSMGSRGSETGNREKATLGAQMKNIDDGEYAAYPPQGGWLQITVKATLKGSVWVHKSGHNNNYWRELTADDYKNIYWLLYKAPEVSVVTSGLQTEEVERDDIEYSGYINSDAKDDIEIDTVCGTMEDICPTAKGVYLDSGQNQVKTMYRAGRANRAEKLLIGTLHSQYAGRKTKLTGTRTLTGGGLLTLTDAMLDGVRMIETGAVEDLGEETCETTAVELRPDEYDEE